MRLLIISSFILCGAMIYAASHWLAWTDSAYQRVFWSPFRPVALSAAIIDRQLGVGWLLAGGFVLGSLVVAFLPWPVRPDQPLAGRNPESQVPRASDLNREV